MYILKTIDSRVKTKKLISCHEVDDGNNIRDVGGAIAVDIGFGEAGCACYMVDGGHHVGDID